MIDFDEGRWQRIRRNYGDWWAGRREEPLIAVTVSGYDQPQHKPSVPLHNFTSFYRLDTPADSIVDAWEWSISGKRYVGDAFPSIWPNFGPGVIAAFLGCDLHTSVDSDTTWFSPRETRESTDLEFVTDRASVWYRRVRDIVQAADDRFGGTVQIGMTDLGGNLDIVSSFRPGEQLLLDLYDCPEEVDRLTWQAHACWWEYFDLLTAAAPHNPGYSAWAPIFSEEPYYMLQCDFSYMIGPDMFDRFVKPELAACCRRLKNAFYHLDGPGELPHLDSLLEIPELKGVQWVPGAGQPDITHWPDVYRRIHKAGKRIQLFGGQAEIGVFALDALADQLGTAEGLIMIADADRKDEEKVQRLLQRHGVT